MSRSLHLLPTAQQVTLSQLLDDAYFKKYYQQKTKSGLSINDLELQLQADEAWQPFRSKSPDVRMLAGQTALLYSVSAALAVRHVKQGICPQRSRVLSGRGQRGERTEGCGVWQVGDRDVVRVHQ